jgi:hypothetical protein
VQLYHFVNTLLEHLEIDERALPDYGDVGEFVGFERADAAEGLRAAQSRGANHFDPRRVRRGGPSLRWRMAGDTATAIFVITFSAIFRYV